MLSSCSKDLNGPAVSVTDYRKFVKSEAGDQEKVET